MPNGYAVIPNILPGNVTIGGNLTLTGSEIKLGAAAPFTRLVRAAGGNALFTNNLQSDLATRDDGAQAANALDLFQATVPLLVRRMNAAGNFMDVAPAQALFTDFVQHNNSGNVAENTIWSKVIRANTLGANGGFRVRAGMQDVAQGGVPTNIRFKLGGVTFFTTAIAAVSNMIWDFVVCNRNATNSQVWEGIAFNVSAGTVAYVNAGTAVDTTADTTFSVTSQSGAAGDSQNFNHIVVTLMNSFGPV